MNSLIAKPEKMTFREEITAQKGQSRIVLTKIVLHEICKMDFCCITNWFLDFVEKDKPTGGLNG